LPPLGFRPWPSPLPPSPCPGSNLARALPHRRRPHDQYLALPPSRLSCPPPLHPQASRPGPDARTLTRARWWPCRILARWALRTCPSGWVRPRGQSRAWRTSRTTTQPTISSINSSSTSRAITTRCQGLPRTDARRPTAIIALPRTRARLSRLPQGLRTPPFRCLRRQAIQISRARQAGTSQTGIQTRSISRTTNKLSTTMQLTNTQYPTRSASLPA